MEEHLRRLIELAQEQHARLATFQVDCACQEYTESPASQDGWTPHGPLGRARNLVDDRMEDSTGRQFRVDYHPDVIRWIKGSAPFITDNHTIIGYGHERSGPIRGLTGEGFLLCRFGRRKYPQQIGPVEAEPVRLARSLLQPDQQYMIEGQAAAWDTLENGVRAVRLDQTFRACDRQVYWLDPARGYALLRYAEANGGGELRTVFEVENCEPIAPDFWYPSKASSFQYSPSPTSTRPVQVETGSNAEAVTTWRSTKRAPFLRPGPPSKWTFEFSGAQAGVEVPKDAFDSH
jgi:hypothetical protein